MISSTHGFTAWLKVAKVDHSICFITPPESTVTHATLSSNASRHGYLVEIKRTFITIPDDKNPTTYPGLVVTMKGKR